MEQIIIDNGSMRKESGKNSKEIPDNESVGKYDESSREKLYDMGYLEKVNDFCDKKINSYGENDNDEIYPKMLQKEKNDLQKLAVNGNLENLNPQDFSLALALLTEQMNCEHKYEMRNDHRSAGDKKRHEEDSLQAKEIFMKSCEKIYPDIDKVKPVNLANLTRLLRSSGSVTDNNINFEAFEAAEISKISKKNPDIDTLKKVANKLQDLLSKLKIRNDWRLAEYAEVESNDNMSRDNDLKEYNDKQEMTNQHVYELMIIRDIVYEKLYGNKNITVEDARKIDETREKVKNPNNPDKK